MSDISMCKNEECPLKKTCYRYVAIPNDYWQAYGQFVYNNGCDWYIEVSSFNSEITKNN